MSAKASVIVLVWNGGEFLDACLSAVLGQECDSFEVIVVDNASTDNSVALVQKHMPPVQLVRNAYNLGYAAGNNVGISIAGGEIVVLLNQDTVVQPGWLRAIVDAFDDPTIGIVGCKALYKDGRGIQHAGAFIRPDDAFAFHKGRGEADHGQYDVLTDSDYVTGAAMAIHRRVLDKVGMLDEQFYPGFYEEIDYCYRARRAGFRVAYQPRAVFLHHESASLPADSYAQISAFQRNRVRFVLRHWDADAFQAFAAAEQRAIAETVLPEDALARARAYWDNLIRVPLIAAQRQTDPTLGKPLVSGQSRWWIETLQMLRQQAQDRVVTLMRDAPRIEPVNLPIPLPTVETKAPIMRRLDPTGSQTSEGSNQPTTQNQVVGSLKPLDLQRMQAILQDMEAQCALREGEMRSQVPVIGGWITRLRRFWISLAVRHYVLPALHQQSEHNAQMLLVLKEAVQSLITLQRQNEMLVQQNAALTRLRLMSEDEASISMVLHEINEMLVQQNAALTRLRLMSEDEASISMVLQEIVGKLTGRT